MKEFRDILNAYHDSDFERHNFVICTVVALQGSSYRRSGARMLIRDDGNLTGAISGGCLEGDALRKALLVIANRQSKIVTYDTSDEEDALIGAQLGCEGVIDVLFEPIIKDGSRNPLTLLSKALKKRQEFVVVSLYNLQDRAQNQIGTCILLEADGSITGDVPLRDIKDQVISEANNVLKVRSSRNVNYICGSQIISAFIEYVAPPISLIVVGAGNDAIPLVNFADAIGWETTVVDGRNTLAKRERFVGACQILVSKPERILDQIQIDRRTAVVLMTHNYNYDLAMLKALVKKDIRYIGSLGPKKKLKRMLDDMNHQGIEITIDERNKIFGPVGLEIGAETAEEIAVSIIAEIQAVFHDKKGGMLREKPDVIHSRIGINIPSNKIKDDA
jgi:xanthine dehydrogenase accessory factor